MAKTAMKTKKSTDTSTSIDKAFYMVNGEVITSLRDLPESISRSDDGTYYYHVTDSKNDFAAWINDVFGNSKLASLIGPEKNRDKMVKILKRELK